MTDQKQVSEVPASSEMHPSSAESLHSEKRSAKSAVSESTLMAMLRQRVRVSLASEVKWMTGYDALAHSLRSRSLHGDRRAAELLLGLVKYADVADQSGHALQPTIAPQTPEERDLSQAFRKRVIEQRARLRRRIRQQKRFP